VEDAKCFTNCATIEDACSLLELACTAKALTLYCVHNPFRRNNKEENPVKSVFLGVPVIDTRVLLKCIDAPDASALAEYEPINPPPETKRFQNKYKTITWQGGLF